MIRNALSVVPSRPIVVIVPLIVVLVMSFYYWDIYSKCADNKLFRTSFNELVHSVDTSAPFRLMDMTDFRWDRVRIVTNFEPEKRNTECPFGWNWSSGERDSLIASGLLTVLLFAQEGMIVRYFELRSDKLAFRGANSSLTPEAAVFSIGKNSDNSSGVTLTLSK
jgi:hypothetical protein